MPASSQLLARNAASWGCTYGPTFANATPNFMGGPPLWSPLAFGSLRETCGDRLRSPLFLGGSRFARLRLAARPLRGLAGCAKHAVGAHRIHASCRAGERSDPAIAQPRRLHRWRDPPQASPSASPALRSKRFEIGSEEQAFRIPVVARAPPVRPARVERREIGSAAEVHLA